MKDEKLIESSDIENEKLERKERADSLRKQIESIIQKKSDRVPATSVTQEIHSRMNELDKKK